MFHHLAKTIDLHCFGPNVLTLCSRRIDTQFCQKQTLIAFWSTADTFDCYLGHFTIHHRVYGTRPRVTRWETYGEA